MWVKGERKIGLVCQGQEEFQRTWVEDAKLVMKF